MRENIAMRGIWEGREGGEGGVHWILGVRRARGGEVRSGRCMKDRGWDVGGLWTGPGRVVDPCEEIGRKSTRVSASRTVLSPRRTTWQESVAVSPACTVTVVLWRPRKAGRSAASTVVVGGGSEVAGGASMLGAKPPAAPTWGGKGKEE